MRGTRRVMSTVTTMTESEGEKAHVAQSRRTLCCSMIAWIWIQSIVMRGRMLTGGLNLRQGSRVELAEVSLSHGRPSLNSIPCSPPSQSSLSMPSTKSNARKERGFIRRGSDIKLTKKRLYTMKRASSPSTSSSLTSPHLTLLLFDFLTPAYRTESCRRILIIVSHASHKSYFP